MDQPIQLMPVFRERVWGRQSLAPYFPVTPRNEPIGEVWFTAEENLTSLNRTLGDLIRHYPEMLGSGANPRYPGVCPLLLKIIFTNDRLSVQVHPDDDYAQEHHQSLGKTEAWYVLDANPLGKLALGFRKALSREELRHAAQSGEIERLLDWRPVQAGDVFYVPAGTVHVIGEGLTICEIQENSDITYRLYDFGRGRELHLNQAIEVARREPHSNRAARVTFAPWREELLSCSYFRVERLRPKQFIKIEQGRQHYLLFLCVRGAGRIGQQEFSAGQGWFVPAGGTTCHLDAPDSEWIAAYAADNPTGVLHGQ